MTSALTAEDRLRYAPLKFPPGLFKARRETRRIVVHSLDTRPDWKFDIREIDRWHREERGWAAIGYHFVISREGIIVPGRPVDVIGAHCAGWNSTSIGIALAGGKDAIGMGQPANTLFTDIQLDHLRLLIGGALRLWPDAVVVGHRDHPKVKKLCPGFDVGVWFNGND